MPHYKAPDNSIHFIELKFAHLLPVGSVAITDEEVAALQAQPDPKEAIKAKIAALEATITPRRLREALMTGDNTFIASVDAEIALLRAQL